MSGEDSKSGGAPPKKGGRRGNGEGYVERRGGVWYGRLVLTGGDRPWLPLGKCSEEKARAKLAALSERGRQSGQLNQFVDRVRATQMAPRKNRKSLEGDLEVSVRELVRDWTTGKLFDVHGAVNRLRPIASSRINAWTLNKTVLDLETRGPRKPKFGDLRVIDVTPEDIAKIMAMQPREHAAQTRMHTYQRLRRVFDLAEFPCRLRTEGTNPVKRHLRPERDEEKLYCYLYPSELVALLRCRKIPVGRRVLYAVAVYTGLRKGSLYSLLWRGVDFEHGTISAFRVKGKQRVNGGGDAAGRPIFSRGDPSLLKLLHAWWIYCGRPAPDKPLISGVEVDQNHDEARVLREDLAAVGITRELLFSDAPNVEAIRFHDCRSTFCTWARRAGKSDAWIAERTGHRLSGSMIDRYTRQAQTLGDLEYESFPDISRAIPELAEHVPAAPPPPTPPATAARQPERGAGDPRTTALTTLLAQATELADAGQTAAAAGLVRGAQPLVGQADDPRAAALAVLLAQAVELAEAGQTAAFSNLLRAAQALLG